MTLQQQAEAAKAASYRMMTLSTPEKNGALCAMADALTEQAQRILDSNRQDMEKARERGISDAMLDRLRLTEARIEGMAGGLRKVATLPDPVGEEDYVVRRPNGLMIGKRRVPLGVVGIIYEARPNVTADAIGLCLKSGNAVILRGGSEAIGSNIAIASVLSEAAYRMGVPEGAIQLVQDTSRETARALMQLNGYLDVLIPRGGAALIRSVVENATVPVIETGIGNCHVFIENSADPAMAREIILNAKTSRPAVCNAAETLLVEREIAMTNLKGILAPLLEKGVEIRGCSRTCALIPEAIPASESDWGTEYDDMILAVRIVEGLDEAIAHINRYGTRHSEAIITNDYAASERFLNEIDAAAVYVNASTRFTDGEEFGFGAEIGISTQKLHARGPMGLKELTSIKYILRGSGQVR